MVWISLALLQETADILLIKVPDYFEKRDLKLVLLCRRSLRTSDIKRL